MNWHSRISIALTVITIFTKAACVMNSPTENHSNISTNTADNIGKQKANDKPTAANVPANSLASSSPAPSPKSKSLPANAVCFDPNKPCKGSGDNFADWDIPFGMPKRTVPNKSYKSAPFYAIVLKKLENSCPEFSITPDNDVERLEIQKLYPTRKVFATYDCPDLNSIVYDFEGRRDKEGRDLYMSYIAVYAGQTSAEANLALMEALKKFSNAEIKNMVAYWTVLEF